MLSFWKNKRKEEEPEENLTPVLETMVRKYLNEHVKGWAEAKIVGLLYERREHSLLVTIHCLRAPKIIGVKGSIVIGMGNALSRGLDTPVKITITHPPTWEEY